MAICSVCKTKLPLVEEYNKFIISGAVNINEELCNGCASKVYSFVDDLKTDIEYIRR